MAEEQIDIVDENLNPVGTALKSEAHRHGLWHFSIHCWIVRPGGPGYVLFQKRAKSKDLFPDKLDISAAGHYRAGEVAADGTREIMEELGLDVAFDDLVSLGIKVDLGRTEKIKNYEFCRVFLLADPRPIEDYAPDPSEVEGLVQVPIDEGLDLMSGRKSQAKAEGIEWDADAEAWVPWTSEIHIDSFIPRVDSYYYKIFIMARLLLAGSSDLSI